MKLFWNVTRKGVDSLRRRFTLLTISIVAALLPAIASADEGNVVLKFSGSDKNYLYISLILGFVALAFAWYLTTWVKKQSEGSEKMREVSGAIKEGALAYLARQVKTMSVFVLLLAIGLYFQGASGGDSKIGLFIALAFVAGVAASYTAGYVGMLMAVEGNKRTANAALSSYALALKIAFRSGGVAGMVTVGMGLIGAATIFLLAGADAMRLLIGFGFGGSLAALFMRVGGGIFTKAADVGADLVGKVEAGIPEDDPRNPATIADNVGDNVGDCAGMAADIFESYEVTLVAAIVLGAATSSIFDQTTWMKLVLFALMARGAGILASIIGILVVKGNDDLDSDPLMAIRKGFWISATIAAAGTGVLAYMMLGPSGGGIKSSRPVDVQVYQRKIAASVIGVRDRIAEERKIPAADVSVDDIADDPIVKALDLGEKDAAERQISQMVGVEMDQMPPVPSYKGYSKVDWATSKAAGYVTQDPNADAQSGQKFLSLKQRYENTPLSVYEIEVEQPGQPNPADPKAVPTPTKNKLFYGPIDEPSLEKAIKSSGANVKITWYKNNDKFKKIPVDIMENSEGKLVCGVEATQISNWMKFQPQGINYYTDSQATVDKYFKEMKDNPGKAPATKLHNESGKAVALEVVSVPWWTFFAAILFGIFMAFAIEALTDYYVSLHKKPVNEVAGVASAGPAPMIIQGFALGAESSVFMVFAIVIALLVPLFLFPAALYGGYILSFYGIALVGLGLLTTTGFILAMDTFGPISDNAQGVFEMSGAGHDSPNGSKAVQRLDAAGNTTKALTKGFAITTAVVAAVALFHSYLDSARLQGIGLPLEVPQIFLGLLIGGAAPYLFSAFSINAVGRAAFELINDVRAQFKADPGIMAGTSKPNYARCVAIVTKAAQRELLGPAILAIALPMAVAFGFSIGQPHVKIDGHEYNLVGAQALGGFLAGAILSGQLMAVLLANSGGIWDNAKKLIEDGMHGGKGTEAHKAAVVCDTVGDPFKDTAGPALNPLIKVMNLVALLMAVEIIKPKSDLTLSIITGVCVAALAFSIWWSKRSSMSSGLEAAGALPPSSPAPSVHDSGKRITVDDEK